MQGANWKKWDIVVGSCKCSTFSVNNVSAVIPIK